MLCFRRISRLKEALDWYILWDSILNWIPDGFVISLRAPGGCCNLGYTHLAWKSREITFVHNIYFICLIVLKFFTEHDSVTTAVLWATFTKRWDKWWNIRGKPDLSWRRVTHIYVSKLTTIGSDNGLSPGRLQPIIWTNAGILLMGPLGTNFSEILIEIRTFSSNKMHLKMSSGNWLPYCLGRNVLKYEFRWYLILRQQPSCSPADTLHNVDVVITSKRRHFDVITSNDVVLTL